jgi:hypothetical protein
VVDREGGQAKHKRKSQCRQRQTRVEREISDQKHVELAPGQVDKRKSEKNVWQMTRNEQERCEWDAYVCGGEGHANRTLKDENDRVQCCRSEER